MTGRRPRASTRVVAVSDRSANDTHRATATSPCRRPGACTPQLDPAITDIGGTGAGERGVRLRPAERAGRANRQGSRPRTGRRARRVVVNATGPRASASPTSARSRPARYATGSADRSPQPVRDGTRVARHRRGRARQHRRPVAHQRPEHQPGELTSSVRGPGRRTPCGHQRVHARLLERDGSPAAVRTGCVLDVVVWSARRGADAAQAGGSSERRVHPWSARIMPTTV